MNSFWKNIAKLALAIGGLHAIVLCVLHYTHKDPSGVLYASIGMFLLTAFVMATQPAQNKPKDTPKVFDNKRGGRGMHGKKRV
jgi:hypothetical protein